MIGTLPRAVGQLSQTMRRPLMPSLDLSYRAWYGKFGWLGIMRRRLKTFLLIGLVAVWAQIVAPLVPYFAVAAAGPISSMEICSGMTGTDGLDHQSDQKRGSPACILHCALAHAGVALLGNPEQTPSVLVRSVARTVWIEHPSHDGIDRRHSPAQARAPPLFS